MADRLTVQEFFDALRAQKISPLVDTPAVRASVDVWSLGYSDMTSVLLVDDDAETLAAWESTCAADGFQVKTASDGKSALAMFIESPVDIVVADWRMPVMSGSELCHRLRTLPGLADVAFIPISGEPSPPAFISYDGFRRKPADGQILLATMRRLLADNVQHRQLQRGGAT